MPSRMPTPRATPRSRSWQCDPHWWRRCWRSCSERRLRPRFAERLGTVDCLMALGERIGAVAIEQIFERGQALECDALLGELIGQRRGLVSVSKCVLHLLEPNAFRVRAV